MESQLHVIAHHYLYTHYLKHGGTIVRILKRKSTGLLSLGNDKKYKIQVGIAEFKERN